jgi:hypothetical protein
MPTKGTKPLYQHVRPQDFDESKGHLVTPKGGRMICATCGKAIKRVDENDGPEGLKALFRF